MIGRVLGCESFCLLASVSCKSGGRAVDLYCEMQVLNLLMATRVLYGIER